MQIESMISDMRNRSIMKDKQKTNLKLYDEIEAEELLEDFEQEAHEAKRLQTQSSLQARAQVEEEAFEWGEDEELEEEFEEFAESFYEDFEELEEFDDEDISCDSQFERELEKWNPDDLFGTFSSYMDALKQEAQANLTSRSPQSIYEENEIKSDLKSGIFMVDMYRMNLPDELDEKIKHKSVIDILNAFEISQEVLECDARDRKAALESYMQDLKRKSGESISEYRETIRRLEGFVEEINQMISCVEEFYKAQFKVMKAEQSKIESALQFMKGQDFLKNKIHKKTQTKRSMKKQSEGK